MGSRIGGTPLIQLPSFGRGWVGGAGVVHAGGHGPGPAVGAGVGVEVSVGTWAVGVWVTVWVGWWVVGEGVAVMGFEVVLWGWWGGLFLL